MIGRYRRSAGFDVQNYQGALDEIMGYIGKKDIIIFRYFKKAVSICQLLSSRTPAG
jgi:hypothetical protein